MNKKINSIIILINCFSGCGLFTPQDIVSQPSKLTLQEAMKSAAAGFVAWQKCIEISNETGGECTNLPTQADRKNEMTSVGHGIYWNKYNDKNYASGLYPCKATVTFNVAADATTGNTLVIDANIKPAASYGLEFKESLEQSAKASRGNVITIDMVNPYCLPKDTLIGMMYSPITEQKKLEYTLKENPHEYFSQNKDGSVTLQNNTNAMANR